MRYENGEFTQENAVPYITYHNSRVFYREQGAGPLLIILPGNTASAAVHVGDLEHFSQAYHCVAVDLPGTGQSDRMDPWPDDWWRYSAGCVAALVAHLDEGPAVLLGTSGGAVVALHAAVTAPQQVRAVVADSCVSRQPPAVLEAEISRRAQAGPELVSFWAYAHGEDWQAVIEADSALLLRHARRDGSWFANELSSVVCPVLFTGSMKDMTLHEGPVQMLGMCAQIAESEVSLVNGGDHPLMLTRPEAFRGIATSFLQRLE